MDVGRERERGKFLTLLMKSCTVGLIKLFSNILRIIYSMCCISRLLQGQSYLSTSIPWSFVID